MKSPLEASERQALGGSSLWLCMSHCSPEVSAVLHYDRKPPLALIVAPIGARGTLASHMMRQAIL